MLAGLAITLSAPAHATLVQWEYQGYFTDIDPGLTGNFTPGSPDIAAGKSFSILASFDSDASLTQKLLDVSDGTGYRYRYSNSSLTLQITAGAFSSTISGGAFSPLQVRDGFLGPDNLTQVDSILLQMLFLNDDQISYNNGLVNIDASFALGLRTADTSALTVTNDKMVTQPIPVVVGMQANYFQYCRSTSGTTDCSFGAVNGVLTSVTSVTAVPEPSTYALMFIGLGVVGFASRRRKA